MDLVAVAGGHGELYSLLCSLADILRLDSCDEIDDEYARPQSRRTTFDIELIGAWKEIEKFASTPFSYSRLTISYSSTPVFPNFALPEICTGLPKSMDPKEIR